MTDGGGVTATLFDCADRANLGEPRCLRPHEVVAGTIGAGPGYYARPRGGFLDGATLVVAFEPTDRSGFLMSIDLATGDRTLRSGEQDDPALGLRVVGEGPALDSLADVEKGEDGWYVLTPSGLIRVDPTTGDRELARPFAPCMRDDGPWQIERTGFALADDGTAYISSFSVRSGSGVVSLAPDGTCEVVTWYPEAGYEGRGTGPGAPGARFGGLVLHEGALYMSASATETIYRVDLATGDRVAFSSSLDGREIGPGDELVVGGDLVFASSGGLYTTGSFNDGIPVTDVDIDTGARTSVRATHGPLRLEWSQSAPMWPYPGTDALIIGVLEAVAVFEPATGNSFLLSF